MFMEDKKGLKERIVSFRDGLKEYRVVWIELKKEAYNHRGREVRKSLSDKEEKMRERLTEEWGRLRKIFHYLGVCVMTITPGIGYRQHIFEEALSGQLIHNILKGESLVNAISSATQAIGEVESLTETEFNRFTQKTPNLFLAHSFREENEKMVARIKKLLESFPLSITTGEKPTTKYVSEKVKKLIADSDYVLVILTKDEEQKDKSWQPSKWLNDELAFALGKGKTIIRFLEKGVDYKPAISGDSEYIPFNKDNLTDALIKLVQLLNTVLK